MMKHLILVITFFMLCRVLLGPESRAIFIAEAKAINPYWRIMDAIAWVESRGRDSVINYTELAYGIYQVRQCRLDDYYRRTGVRYTLDDMLDRQKAEKVFLSYATEIGFRQPERIARLWNGGPGGMNYRQTAKYWQMVLKCINN